MAIRISRESLPPTFSSSCASTSYSLHLNFIVLVGPGCNIKTVMGEFNLKELIHGLIKERASMWVTARDKLLKKRYGRRGQQRIVRLYCTLPRSPLYSESGNSFLNLSGIHVGNLHFTSVVCALGSYYTSHFLSKAT